MAEELINQMVALFDTQEKWYDFLDLWECDWNQMADIMYRKIPRLMNNYFSKQDLYPEWKWEFPGNHFEERKIMPPRWEAYWFPDSIGEEIWIHLDRYIFTFVVKEETHNLKEVERLLKTDRFIPITAAMRKDFFPGAGGKQIAEEGNWSFGSKYDGNFSYEQLAWFAEYETESFFKQIVEKVERFTKNEEVRELMVELHNETMC